jgi:hypothetical protein
MTLERYAVAGAYPIRFKAKQPTETQDYTLDFGPLAALAAPTTLTGVAWSVAPLTGDATPLTISSQPFVANVSTVRLSAGSALVQYTVSGVCTWSDGESTVVFFALPIASPSGSAIPS